MLVLSREKPLWQINRRTLNVELGLSEYRFPETLIKGLIKSRPNRFIMMVEIDGVIEKCHCPSTGRIGNIDFCDIPCLLSRSDSKKRKTNYTVEAIYPVSKSDTIVGINQVKANTYINFFLEHNLLPEMLLVETVKREVFLNTSKIDFLINDNCYVEVKTLLKDIPFGIKKSDSKFTSFERLLRHYNEISTQINANQKSIVLLCNLFDAKPFAPPLNNATGTSQVRKVVKQAIDNGIEHWQINLKVTADGVSLIDYFKVDLLPNLK